jgi:hypothetical protein
MGGAVTELRAPANEIQRKLLSAIAELSTRLYVIVGQTEAQAHLLGNLVLERRDGEDLIFLSGTETHVHINWGSVSNVTHSQRDGYDCISFFDQERVLFEILPESSDYRFTEDILTCMQEQRSLLRLPGAVGCLSE